MEGYGIDVNQKKWVGEPSPDPVGIKKNTRNQLSTKLNQYLLKGNKMKKNFIVLFIFSVTSFAAGCYLEKRSQFEIMNQARSIAARYMDSVQRVNNNLMVSYIEIPYLRELERHGTMANRNGYVPDARTAARIAVSVWSSLYGEYIPQEKPPMKVALKGDSLWIVFGTLLPNYEGGTPYIEISKKNGTIYKVNHEK